MIDLENARNVAEVIKSIDWSFSGPFKIGRADTTLFDARKYHWYPATFIPEIPYTLIEVLSRSGDRVLDPFGGLGTTAFQAAFLGRRPVACDISRVGLAVARDLWTLLGAAGPLPRADHLWQRVAAEFSPSVDYSSQLAPRLRAVPLLREWYRPETLQELCYLRLALETIEGEAEAAALRIVLSSAYKSLSGQDRGWGCVADNMRPTEKQLSKGRDVFARVERNLSGLLRDLNQYRATMTLPAKHIFTSLAPDEVFYERDVRRDVPINPESVDLIVTSPPYPEMTDYTTSQRLSYYWVGADLKPDVRREIGARRKRFRRSSLEEYRGEMQSALAITLSSLRPGGYAAFVMPTFEGEANTRRRATVDALMEVPDEGPWELVTQVIRALPPRRRHHNQNWTSLEKEAILVFRCSP